MPFLRQSTAQVILFGPCLDIGDGVTEETSLTLAQADMRLSQDGGAFAQKGTSGNATHDSDGWYNTTLSTADTDTVGELILNVHQPANMLPVWVRWWVIEEAVYDAIYGASAEGPLQATTAGRKLDITAAGEAGLDLDNTTGTIAAAQLATDAVNKIARAIGVQTNTAFPDVEFLMVDSTDHVTPKTGRTVTGEVSIDGGAFAAVNGSTVIAEVSDGIYQVDIAAADLNGTVCTFRFSATASDDTFLTIKTVA